MHSSISNSKSDVHRAGKRDIAVLLALCVSFCVLVELGSRLYFDRLSRMEHRRQTEYGEALTIRSLKPRAGSSVLVVGNSLLLEDVNFPVLQQDIGPGIDMRRVVVENTFYLDWYYGLRKLFRHGAQPDIVVVVLNPLQLTSPIFDGGYSAHFLMDGRDLLNLAKDNGADRNEISEMALEHVSTFYGTRTEIRTWLLDKLLPQLPNLFRSKPVLPKPLGLNELASRRLAQLRDLCAEHGSRLVVVLPPARLNSGLDIILPAAEANSVSLLLPINPGVLPSSDYSDNFHLNSHGARKFTPALADALKQMLNRLDTGEHPADEASLSSSTHSIAATVVSSDGASRP
jgi:hypothetical protein